MESKTKDDERLKHINTSISMNYQSKPIPFFSFQNENQVVKNFENKTRMKTMPRIDQISSKVESSSFSNPNAFTMHHQDKPTSYLNVLLYY